MKRIGMLTSGGDCQALNATMRGVAKGLYNIYGNEVEIIGFIDGYKGLIYEDYRKLTPIDFTGLLTRGGTILGSSRQPFKLMREPDENGLDKVEAMKYTYRRLRLDCLVGGVPGLTEHIQVHSIVGRYLEHARIYIFGLGERKQVYISSADLMTRNTTRRVEVAAPVRDPRLREQLETMFRDELRDTAKGRVQRPDGEYVRAEGEPFNSQEHFCDQAYSGAWALERPRPEAPKPAPKPEVKLKKAPAPPAKAAPPKQPPQVRRTRRGLLGRLIGRD